jgi:transposase InsO family protein
LEYYSHIHCKYSGLRGFVRLYDYGLKWRYMITNKAKQKARILTFWEKHGLSAALDAFPVKRSTLFLWKKNLLEGGGRLEALNDQSRQPQTKRKRQWPDSVLNEIKRLRWDHPNLGKDKVHPLLLKSCLKESLPCPKISTIGRLIKDLGGLRITPQKISHFGRIKPLKRAKVLRKPKDFQAEYPGHLVALDTIERFIFGVRRYIITFEDIYTRFSFAWGTKSHASLAAKEFFDYCRLVFPYPMTFVLTDNGSEFKKHFNQALLKLHLTHYHTYPKTPKMNSHCERFNRTIQEEFVDYHASELLEPATFNHNLITWLIWYNTERVHFAFQNKLSPVQYIMSLERANKLIESKIGWTHTQN